MRAELLASYGTHPFRKLLRLGARWGAALAFFLAFSAPVAAQFPEPPGLPPDLPPGRPPSLVPALPTRNAFLNLSTRGRVGIGEDVLIAGLVLEKRSTVLVRGIGPGLARYGVTAPLARGRLELRAVDGRLLASNTHWVEALGGQSDILQDAMHRIGAFPLERAERDTAIWAELDAGSYSVIFAGAEGSTGIGLVEAYLVPTLAAAP